ncbi:MAG: Rnase Y domain-containing protein, partial [Planctomycetota bacterium]
MTPLIALTSSEIGLGIAGLVLGAGAVFLYFLIVVRGAKANAEAIVEKANRDAENRLKDTEIQCKEMQLKLEAESERKLGKAREKLHQRERKLDKQETQLNQQKDDLRKQEQFIQSNQNRIKVKLEQITQTETDLTEILEKQRKQLHQVTGLSKKDAQKRLLKLLEDELADEVGGRILKHERKMKEICEQKAREILLVTTQRFAATYTSDHTTSTIDIPN